MYSSVGGRNPLWVRSKNEAFHVLSGLCKVRVILLENVQPPPFSCGGLTSRSLPGVINRFVCLFVFLFHGLKGFSPFR